MQGIGGGNIRASGQLITTYTAGAPLNVGSNTTKVTNLNADLLNNNNSAYYTNLANMTGSLTPSRVFAGNTNTTNTSYNPSGYTTAATVTFNNTNTGILTAKIEFRSDVNTNLYLQPGGYLICDVTHNLNTTSYYPYVSVCNVSGYFTVAFYNKRTHAISIVINNPYLTNQLIWGTVVYIMFVLV